MLVSVGRFYEIFLQLGEVNVKGIVIYFTLGGTTEKFAKKVADRCGFYTYQVNLKKSMGNLNGKYNPQLEDFEINYDDYDIVVFGFSVMLRSFIPALKKFYRQHPISGKKIATFSIFHGREENSLLQVVHFFKKK